MGKFYAFLLGVLAGCGLYHMASSYHFVRAESGFHMVPKLAQGLGETYVDVRAFGPEDWVNHPQLSAAAMQSGNQALIGGAVENTVDEALRNVVPGAGQE